MELKSFNTCRMVEAGESLAAISGRKAHSFIPCKDKVIRLVFVLKHIGYSVKFSFGRFSQFVHNFFKLNPFESMI